jgi:predicted NUDIX family phosphoesterase
MNRPFFQFGKLYQGKEQVLVVPSATIFAQGQWQGFLMDRAQDFIDLIKAHHQWLPRNQVEHDPDFQQIIPWAVFRVGDRYLELKRTQEGSHSRLYSKYTLGIGGHVIRSELNQDLNLADWINRKFHEEVHYEGQIHISPLGVVNDNVDELGKGHFGMVYLFEGNTDLVGVIKHAEGRLVKLLDITGEDVDFLDRWSQMVYRQLRDQHLEST